MRLRLPLAALLAATAMLAPAAPLAAQAVLTPVLARSAGPGSIAASRSVTVDFHLARARDQRHAGRFKEALASLDSVLAADPRAGGAHPMRALVYAELGKPAQALAALRDAHLAGDTLAFATALQVGNGQYRTATISRQAADYAIALPTLQLAELISPAGERRAVTRLLVAATSLSLATLDLPANGGAPSCGTLGATRERVALARTSLAGAEAAPATQVAQVRGALEQLSTYADAQARRLGCA